MVATAALIVGLLSVAMRSAFAEECLEVYFGSGCFWHVQHEFIHAEETILGRTATNYTSLSGYAGGTGVADPQACYNNYKTKGHTEVVRVLIPSSKLSEFAVVFWDLFVNYDRIDTMDKGPGYRAAIGISGGMNSPHFQHLRPSDATWELEVGQGNDADTLGSPLVWVYDIDSFPFHQAEEYHQFHDDFMPGGRYPQSYNDLKDVLHADCRMRPTGCYRDQGALPTTCPAIMAAAASNTCIAAAVPMWNQGEVTGSEGGIEGSGSGLFMGDDEEGNGDANTLSAGHALQAPLCMLAMLQMLVVSKAM